MSNAGKVEKKSNYTKRSSERQFKTSTTWEERRKNSTRKLTRYLIWKPASFFIFGTGFLTLLAMTYFVWLNLTWIGVKYNVAVHPDHLEIIGKGLEAEAAWSFLQPGDKIVALDDTPLQQVFEQSQGSGANHLKLKFLPIQKGSNELSALGTIQYDAFQPLLQVSPNEVGKEDDTVAYLLYGIAAHSLIVDTSYRQTGSQSVNSIQAKSGIEILENGLLKVTISELKGNFNGIGLVLMVLLITISYVGLSFVLFALRPSVLTGVFAFSNYIFTLWCGSSNSSESYFGSFQILTLVAASGLHWVLNLHFILLFPDGDLLGRRTKWVLKIVYLLCIALIVSRVWLLLMPEMNEQGMITEGAYNLERDLRRLSMFITIGLLLIAMSILFGKFWRSRGERRVRLKFAVLSIFAAASIPQGAALYYAVVSLWHPVVYDNFTLFFTVTIIVPFGFGYAVLKNRLLGISLTLRRSVVHLLVSGLVITAYLILSLVIALFLPDLRALNKEPLFVSIVLCVLGLGLYRLRDKVQHLVDRIFRIDVLQYPVLTRKWHVALGHATDLASLCTRILQDMPRDYHYSRVALLLTDAQLHQVLERSLPNGSVLDNQTGEAEFRGKRAWLLELSLANNVKQSISASSAQGIVYNTTNEAVEVIKNGVSYTPLVLSSEAVANLAANSIGNEGVLAEHSLLRSYLLTLPLTTEQNCYGLVLLGAKNADYLPAEEEVEHLNTIAGQIAISLTNSLALTRAMHLAQTEKQLREVYQEILKREEQAREEERAKIADAIHGDVLQYLNLLYRNLEEQSLQLNPVNSQKLVDASLYQNQSELPPLNNPQMLRQAIGSLYDIIHDLSPIHVKQNFVSELMNLFGEYRHQHSSIKFDLQITGERQVIERVLTDKLKMKLYRIMQEACRNALKHATPDTITAWLILEPIVLDTEDGEQKQKQEEVYQKLNAKTPISVEGKMKPLLQHYHLEIGIRDDGKGINADEVRHLGESENNYVPTLTTAHGRFGLSRLKRQVEEENGQLEVISEARQGTQIICSFLLPFEQEQTKGGTYRRHPSFEELLQLVPSRNDRVSRT
jgi:signal transduction histidine kinase